MTEPVIDSASAADSSSTVDESDSLESARERFDAELYLEHLEEASFLYDQCRSLRDDPEVTWRDVGDFEERREKHIDALVAGNERAFPACRLQAMEGDSGELYAAVRLFCRCDRFDFFKRTVNEIDLDDESASLALRMALAADLPDSWIEPLLQLSTDEHPELMPLVFFVSGYRRRDCTGNLTHLLSENTGEVTRWHMYVCGRLGLKEKTDLLTSVLESDDAAMVRYEAALALLRCGDVPAVHTLKEMVNDASWSRVLLGLFGSRNEADLLHTLFASQPSSELLTAIGFLGSTDSISILLTALKDGTFSDAAAEALYLLTGAELFEEYALSGDDDEVEADDEEFAAEEESEVPAEEPVLITRISRSPEDWDAWWSRNSDNFKGEIRYRLGKPFSPQSGIDTISSEVISRRTRQLGYEELVIRYNIDEPFETEMSVAGQLKAIDGLKKKAAGSDAHFTSGGWYYRGRESMGRYY